MGNEASLHPLLGHTHKQAAANIPGQLMWEGGGCSSTPTYGSDNVHSFINLLHGSCIVHIGTSPANTYAGLYDIRERPTALLLIV